MKHFVTIWPDGADTSKTPDFESKAELKKFLVLSGISEEDNNQYEYIGNYKLHFSNFQDLCVFLDAEP